MRYVQTTLDNARFKELKVIALSLERSLGDLVREIIINFLNLQGDKEWQKKMK